MGSIKSAGPSFWPQVFFAVKMHKTLHFLLENQEIFSGEGAAPFQHLFLPVGRGLRSLAPYSMRTVHDNELLTEVALIQKATFFPTALLASCAVLGVNS